MSIRSNAAPRSPFDFVRKTGRAARAPTTATSTLTLVAGALTLAPAPTHAVDSAATREYFSYYRLDSTRQKGYTDKDVTIAPIGGPVDTNAPELAGATIIDKSRCTIDASPAGAHHGIDMAILLVLPYTGVALDATLYTYQIATVSTVSSGTRKSSGLRLSTMAILINQVIDDGAQIISILQNSAERDSELQQALTRVVSEGVIIVAPTGSMANGSSIEQPIHWSGVIGVSVVNSDGISAFYSS